MNSHKTILFLDLEATIIGHWSNWTPIEDNFQLARLMADTMGADVIGLYSYALWGDENIQFLIREKFDWLNDQLQGKLDKELIVPMPAMIEASREMGHNFSALTLHEYWKYVDKVRSFTDFSFHFKKQFPELDHMILIDDTVRDMSSLHVYPGGEIRVTFVKAFEP